MICRTLAGNLYRQWIWWTFHQGKGNRWVASRHFEIRRCFLKNIYFIINSSVGFMVCLNHHLKKNSSSFFLSDQEWGCSLICTNRGLIPCDSVSLICLETDYSQWSEQSPSCYIHRRVRLGWGVYWNNHVTCLSVPLSCLSFCVLRLFTAQPFVTKLGTVVHHCEAKCCAKYLS